jgi:hypothetical protein
VSQPKFIADFIYKAPMAGKKDIAVSMNISENMASQYIDIKRQSHC